MKIFYSNFSLEIYRLYVIDSIKYKNNEVIEILRFDTQAKDEQFVIPPFCKIIKEVTGNLFLIYLLEIPSLFLDDVYFSSFEMAKIDSE